MARSDGVVLPGGAKAKFPSCGGVSRSDGVVLPGGAKAKFPSQEGCRVSDRVVMVTSKVTTAATKPPPAPTKAAEDYGRATQGEVSSEVTKKRNHKPSPVGASGPSREADGYGRTLSPASSQKYPPVVPPSITRTIPAQV